MSSRGPTIWQLLEECVSSLSEPFRASEIIGWFRRHHPEVNEPSLRAHIHGATSNVSAQSRGAFVARTPLLTRIDHGRYSRYRGEAVDRRDRSAASTVSPPQETRQDPGWYDEAKIQSMVVAHLVSEGWDITSVAKIALRERGIDVMAHKGDQEIGVEVKGYPSREYADPERRGTRKPTHPSAQAGTWFAQAILSAMRLRTSRPELVNVIALPDFPRYRALTQATASSLVACEIDVWLVGEDGRVSQPLRALT